MKKKRERVEIKISGLVESVISYILITNLSNIISLIKLGKIILYLEMQQS